MSMSAQSLSLSRLSQLPPVASNPAYRSDVDGLRAVAILGVVINHAYAEVLPGGFAGVDVFFVISGFLISEIILRELNNGGFSFGDFYARRVRRLFPALTVVLCVVWIYGWLILLPDEFQKLGRNLAAAATFSLNLLLYSNTDPYFILGQQPLTHLWSLGVEEQFYFLWPLALVTVRRFGRNPLIVSLLSITVVSFVLNVSEIPWDPLASFYLPWNRLWELSLGAVLACTLPSISEAVAHRGAARRSPLSLPFDQTVRHVAGLLGAAMLAASFMELSSTWRHPGWQGLVPSTGALLLISAGPDSWVNRFVLSQPVMVFVGLISYPLYLWHWPLLSFMHVAVHGKISAITSTGVVVAAFVLAFLTYKVIELPVRHSTNKARSALVLCATMVICGSIGFLSFTQSIPARSRPVAVTKLEHAAEDWVTGKPSISWTYLSPTYQTVGSGPRRVLYIGDSFMQHYYLRIVKVLKEHPHNAHSAVFALRPGCGPLLERESPFGTDACKEHGRRAIEYAMHSTVDAVVIGSEWSGHFMTMQDGKYVFRNDADRSLSNLKSAIDRIGRQKKVYIVLASPVHPNLAPREMIRRTVTPPGFQVEIVPAPTRFQVEARIGPVNSKLVQLARDTGASTIDPVRALCNESTCPSVLSDGEPMYVDGGHIRPSYARESARYMDVTILDEEFSASVRSVSAP
jgi:peptidoglycan/LPS O-acetylase OafA/YrhL